MNEHNPLRRLTEHALFWPAVVLVLLLALNLVVNPGFFRVEVRDGRLYGSLIDILNRASPLIIVSLGMCVVIATRGVDISVGAVVAISAAVAAYLVSGESTFVNGQSVYVPKVPLLVAFAVAIAISVLCGLWNGVLVAGVGMQPIIATLILMVAGRGIAQLITNGQIITVYYKPFHFIGNGYIAGLPFALYLAAALFIVMAALKTRTALGLFIQAGGINPAAARLSGINARGILIAVYGFCGATAGLAGLIISSNVKSADANNAGLMLELDAILAVVLGGTSLAGGRFSLRGTVIGALIIQTLTTTIYSMGVPPEINLVVKALVVFAVCVIQSDFSHQLAQSALGRLLSRNTGRRATT
ncbi:ABC transporter permease [Niveibacterium sp. SC-1]|uniref:ABC transporter permease n=1 Tax=Niveibacterium sp. SC-1 TaxID=3135646 RepID=UPI00311D844B